MFNLNDEKIEWEFGNKEYFFLQGKKAEKVALIGERFLFSLYLDSFKLQCVSQKLTK